MKTSETQKVDDSVPYMLGVKFRKNWIKPILYTVFLFAIFQFFIIQQFNIHSGSMEDTLLFGDQLLVFKFIYGIKIPYVNKYLVRFRNPRPGEIIVFAYPQDPSLNIIKRCMASDGQTIEIHNKEIYVDGVRQILPEHAKFIDRHILPAYQATRDNLPSTTIPEGYIFVMGDNRDDSNDSRDWGLVPYDNIKGRAVIISLSWEPDVPFYNIFHKVRWNRLFTCIR